MQFDFTIGNLNYEVERFEDYDDEKMEGRIRYEVDVIQRDPSMNGHLTLYKDLLGEWHPTLNATLEGEPRVITLKAQIDRFDPPAKWIS